MRRFLTTTALVAFTALPLQAEQHMSQSGETSMEVTVGDQEFRASTMMGAAVYMAAEGGQTAEGNTMSEIPESWTQVGTVEDVFVGQNGEISTVVFAPNDQISSDKDRVGVETASVDFKTSEDGSKIYVVYTGDKVSLEQSEEFDQAAAEAEGQQSAARMDQASNTETEKDGLTIRAGDLTDHAVYVPAENAETNFDEALSEVPAEWEELGDVDSVVLSREGQIKSITLDVGGFLGMGEKEVETSMDDLRFVRDSDSDADNEYFIVYTGDRSMLEDQEEFDREQAEADGNQVMTGSENRMAGNDNMQDRTEQQQADAGDDAMNRDPNAEEQQAYAGDNERMPMTGEEMAQLTASELEGQTVYGSNGDNIGDVSQLVLNDEGKIAEVIVDVGGFLGLGEKPVALPFDELKIERGTGGFDSLEVRVDHTQEDLENMESWTDS